MFALLIVTAALLSPQAPALLLPDGNGAWTIHVTSSGGFLGTGYRDFSVSSEGKIVCGQDLRCPKDFRASDVQPFVEMIHSTLPVPPVAVISICSDCIRRTISIRRRDSMGIVQVYSASWDDTTRGQLPPEVIRVYDAIAVLMK